MDQDPSASELSVSLRGQLLIASPALADGTFDHSVILITEHTCDSGALGIILNHTTGATVGDLVADSALTALRSLPVHHGGPLATAELTFSSLAWSHTSGLEFTPAISPRRAASLLRKNTHIIRATLGHSAWSPGQLENELQRNAWITAKPTPALLTEPNDLNLWNNLLKNISPYHHLLSQAPKNPFLN